MTSDQPVTLGVRDLLRIPDFRRLCLAQAISDIGDGMTLTALFLLVLDLAGASTTTRADVDPGRHAARHRRPVRRAIADRHDRRRIMLASDLLRAGSSRRWSSSRRGSGCRCSSRWPASRRSSASSSPPPAAMLSPASSRARACSPRTRWARRPHRVGVIGAGVTGVIAGVTGLVWPVLVVDAATFLVSVVLVWGVDRRSRSRPAPHTRPRRQDMGLGGAWRTGCAIIGRSRALQAAIVGVSVVMLGVGAINVLFFPFLVSDLGSSPIWSGPLEAAQTLSMILAGALVRACRPVASARRMVTSAWRGSPSSSPC